MWLFSEDHVLNHHAMCHVFDHPKNFSSLRDRRTSAFIAHHPQVAKFRYLVGAQWVFVELVNKQMCEWNVVRAIKS